MGWIKKILIINVIGIVVYVMIAISFALRPSIMDYLDRTDFDSSTWSEWEDTESTYGVRWNMVYDLTNNYDLIGKTRSEIMQLLGPPCEWDKNEMRYYLGLTGHGINTGSLSLKLKNDKVIDIHIWQG